MDKEEEKYDLIGNKRESEEEERDLITHFTDRFYR